MIVGSTAEVDGRVIRHRTSVPRSTTTARPSAVALVAGQRAGQRWWTLRTAFQLCSTGCWGCDQRRHPGTATITLLSAPPLCRCASLTSDPISRSPRGMCGRSRPALICINIRSWPLPARPRRSSPTVRGALDNRAPSRDRFIGVCHERQGSSECRSGDSVLACRGGSPQSAVRGRAPAAYRGNPGRHRMQMPSPFRPADMPTSTCGVSRILPPLRESSPGRSHGTLMDQHAF